MGDSLLGTLVSGAVFAWCVWIGFFTIHVEVARIYVILWLLVWIVSGIAMFLSLYLGYLELSIWFSGEDVHEE